MNSSEAAFRRIVREIADAITRGDLLPGDDIGPIGMLAERYEVGRSTVKRALSILEDRGLVEGQQGRGIFVRSNNP